MPTGYYNESYGLGFEGILNYVNEITNTWFASLFIVFIFTITVVTLSKSEWKMVNVLSFAFFLCFITSLIMRMFLSINGYIIFICLIGLGICVFAGIAGKNK